MYYCVLGLRSIDAHSERSIPPIHPGDEDVRERWATPTSSAGRTPTKIGTMAILSPVSSQLSLRAERPGGSVATGKRLVWGDQTLSHVTDHDHDHDRPAGRRAGGSVA